MQEYHFKGCKNSGHDNTGDYKISALMSLCMMLTFCISIKTPEAAPEEFSDDEWKEISSIISRYYGEWIDTSDWMRTDHGGPIGNTIPSTALLGNGDLGITSGGSNDSKIFYISKSDFWTYRGAPIPIGGLTIKSASGLQGTDLKTARRQTYAKIKEIQDILNAEIRTEMDLAKGEPVLIKTWNSDRENVMICEIASGAEKSLSVEVSVWGHDNRVEAYYDSDSKTITATRMTKAQHTGDAEAFVSKAAISVRVIGTDAGAFTIPAGGRSSMQFVLPAAERGGNGKLVYKPVYIVTAVGGGGRNYGADGITLKPNCIDPVTEAAAILNKITNKNDIDELARSHSIWWKNYWSASYIKLDIKDRTYDFDTMLKYYYAAQYQLACSAREGKTAPGLYGHWHTSDSPMWDSDYHMNYNFIATWYGAAGSNRADTIKPAFDAIYAYRAKAETRAGWTEELANIAKTRVSPRDPSVVFHKDRNGEEWFPQKIKSGAIHERGGIPGALLYPVGILPWGMAGNDVNPAPSYHGQLLDALFNIYPLLEYYTYTLDDRVLKGPGGNLEGGLYDFIKKSLLLYEAWIDKIADGDDYTYDLYAAYNEGSWSVNPAVELAVLENGLKYAIMFSEILDVDVEKRKEWEEILKYLPGQPVSPYPRSGITYNVYTLAELEWNQRTNMYRPMQSPLPPDRNILPMETVIPGEVVGYYSPQAELKIAQDTVRVFSNDGAWRNNNNFPKMFPLAVIVRYPASEIITNFTNTLKSTYSHDGNNYPLMAKNLMVKDPVHGIEKIGATRFINNMMLLSDRGVMKVFPNWPDNTDAKFVRLREKGAFLVSAEYDGKAKEVKEGITLFSEKGSPITLASPWKEGITVTDRNGNEIEVLKGSVPNHPEEVTYTFGTEANMRYTVSKGRG
jgi:hypothetical protein